MNVQTRGIKPWTSGLSSQHYTNKLKRLGQYILAFLLAVGRIQPMLELFETLLPSNATIMAKSLYVSGIVLG